MPLENLVSAVFTKTLDLNQQWHCVDWIYIHVGFFARKKNSGVFSVCKRQKLFKTTNYATIVDYVKTQQHNTAFCLKFLDTFPKEITEVYY